MRIFLPLLPGLLYLSPLLAQKTEFALSLNSGLFSFAGRSATGTSAINFTANLPGYTNDPYGSGAGWCDGLSAEVNRVTHRHLLFGVSLGYEALRSRLDVTSVNISGVDFYSVSAQGHTTLTTQFINFFPSLGYRFRPGKITVDLTGGLDLGYCLGAEENGKAYASNGTAYTASRDRKTITADIRQRLQVAVGYRKTAFYVGYSYGIVNYMAGYVGGPTGAYARFLRFGVKYRI